ncbi:TPA: relaxase/mobilization nuclease domain-containing protein [Neisseria gonorrhoeae]
MAVPMIVQFFNRGKGGGSGPIDYLLGKDRDREEARLLRGDPEETAALINSSVYAKKYTAGCLSFEESNIPAEQKHALMDSFEECIFAGLDKDQYNCLWVEHRDKGRLELNFVIPNIELLSGKRLQPYYYAADRGRVDAWRTMQNLTHGYSDPDDPAKRQSMTQAKDLPRNTQEAAQSITEHHRRLRSPSPIRQAKKPRRRAGNAGKGRF